MSGRGPPAARRLLASDGAGTGGRGPGRPAEAAGRRGLFSVRLVAETGVHTAGSPRCPGRGADVNAQSVAAPGVTFPGRGPCVSEEA